MNHADISESPKEFLMKSQTYQKYAYQTGLCSRCMEHTDILASCCNASILFEGGTIDPDDLWNQIEDELDDYARVDADAEGKDRE